MIPVGKLTGRATPPAIADSCDFRGLDTRTTAGIRAEAARSPGGALPRVVAILVLAQGWQPVPAEAAEVTFGEHVRPILERSCSACHQGPQAQKGLRVGGASDLIRGGESGPAVIPGAPESSLLLAMIGGDRPAMPPVGDRLSQEETAAIRAWIASGAHGDESVSDAGDGERWWSLRPLAVSANPDPADSWGRSPIDGFLLAAMHAKGLAPSEPADRRTLARRLSFDLLGLPPTAETVRDFVEDADAAAYEKLVDRMLASPAYGERWGRHWLDVVRFGESNGYEQNHLRETAWPYRDWVIRSLNDDKPFDRMILEQLAGDRLAPEDLDVQAATGFLVAGPHDTVGIRNPEGEAQKRANHLDDMIMATASAFLGLTVHCARCHDHKFDPIRTEDYYRMQAAFAGVWHGERVWDDPVRVADHRAQAEVLEASIQRSEDGLEALREGAQGRVEARRSEVLSAYRPSVDQAGTEERFDPVAARFVRMTVLQSTGRRNQVELDEFEVWTAGSTSSNVASHGTATASSTRVDSASPDTYAPSNLVDGRFDRRWISSGRPPAWVQVELPQAERIDRVTWSSDRLGGFRGRFARPQPEQYIIEASLDGASWQRVASSDGRLPFSAEAREELLLHAVFGPSERDSWEGLGKQKRRAAADLARLKRPRTAFLGRFEQPEEPSFVMVRGNPMSRGSQVSPGSLSTLGGLLEGFELAPDAPEAERRLALARWIASDENALTARVIVNRVWMHHFGRPIVRNPSDFGANGGEPTHPELLDWLADRLVRDHGWRLKPLHRDIVLSAAYRQSSRYREAAARIDRDGEYLWRVPPRRLGAEELRDAILATSGNLDRRMGGPGFRLYRYTVDNVATYYPLERFAADTFRRSVYHQHARSVKPELLGEFDCPETSLPAPKRISTTSPLQALSLLNSRFVLDQAAAFAALIESRAGTSAESRMRGAWTLAFGREPTTEEIDYAVGFTEHEGLESLGRALLNANEFLFVF